MVGLGGVWVWLSETKTHLNPNIRLFGMTSSTLHWVTLQYAIRQLGEILRLLGMSP